MYKKLFSLFLLFTMILPAQSIYAEYDVSYGIFGKIGVTQARLTKESKRYTIDIHLEATGLAKVLSSGRKEHHISKGHIENGLMVSDLYQVIKSHGDVVVNKEYWINHKTKSVQKKYKKYVKGKLVTDRTKYLDFYAKDDLLTLYFNLDSAIKDKQKSKTYHFEAVGAERQKGSVTVTIPKRSQMPYYHEVLGNDSAWYATAIIHQKIFSSKEGHLMLGIAKDGITNKAVLKDVIFFGDIRAVRTKGN